MATTNLAKPTSFDRTLASARSTMMFSEVVRLAVDSFRASKTRFLLTMLGMVIGSASIILVATLGSTGKQYALDYARNSRFGGTSGEVRVYDDTGENVIDVIPVQGTRAFGA